MTEQLIGFLMLLVFVFCIAAYHVYSYGWRMLLKDIFDMILVVIVFGWLLVALYLFFGGMP